MRKRLFWNPLMKLFRMLKRNRQSVHPRNGHRRRIPMGRSKPISEVTAFFQQTANVTTPHPAQGYDTHFSPSHEWPTSAQPDCQSKADSGMHTHSSISSKDDLQPSTVGQCDTYFSTRFTDIASKTWLISTIRCGCWLVWCSTVHVLVLIYHDMWQCATLLVYSVASHATFLVLLVYCFHGCINFLMQSCNLALSFVICIL